MHANQTPTALDSVVIRIDSQNLYRDVRSVPGFQLDYQKLVRLLARGREVGAKVYYRNLPAQMTPVEQAFVKGLKDQGFRFVVPRVLTGEKPWEEKGTDAAIAAHLVQYARSGQTQVLVSGDGDFRIPVLEARKTGRVEVVGFRQSMSGKLAAAADSITWLDDHIEELRYVPRRQPVPVTN